MMIKYQTNERPGVMLVYKLRTKSYKELPMRMGELGLCIAINLELYTVHESSSFTPG